MKREKVTALVVFFFVPTLRLRALCERSSASQDKTKLLA